MLKVAAASTAAVASTGRLSWGRLPSGLRRPSWFWFPGGWFWLPGRWLGLGSRMGLGLAGRLVGLGSRLGLGFRLGLGSWLGLGPGMGLGLALEGGAESPLTSAS